MGYSIMVLEKLPPEDEETYDNVLEIYEASRKAKTIISRLSDLSRKNTALTFQYISPDDLVQRALEIAAPAKPPKVRVNSNLQCRHFWVHGNEIQLSQMLLNLILNAYQAMEKEGGTLTVTTEQDGEGICFHIADTGPGIDPALVKDIFEPFFTTKERGKGTGLGCGVLTVGLRYYGLFPEGVTYAILLMNACAWSLDRLTPPKRFGTVKGGKVQ